MSRPLRIEFPGALYHVTARGNARAEIFLDDANRAAFLDLLGDICGRFAWSSPAWCLMDNHYHLVVETEHANLSRGMRQLNGVYTQRFNRRHGRVGHVFQGRYKAILVDRDAYLLELARYVVLNPVRARMVPAAGDWPWSSYRATVGAAARPGWLVDDGVLEMLAPGRPRDEAARLYAGFVAEGAADTASADAPSIWEHLTGQLFLGDAAFADRHKRAAPVVSAEVPKAQRHAGGRSVADYAADSDDRRAAMAAAHLDGGHTLAAVARHFGVHYSTVSRAVVAVLAPGEERDGA